MSRVFHFIASILLLVTGSSLMAQRFVKSFNTVADMVAANPSDVNTNAFVAGYRIVNDGGGGIFTYSGASGAATNYGTVFKSAHSSAPASGRWIREYSGAVNVRWFGAVGDIFTDDTRAITNAISTSTLGQTVYFPQGVYTVVSTIVLPNRIKILGDSRAASEINFQPTASSFLFNVGTNRDNVVFESIYLNNTVTSTAVGRVGAILQTPTAATITEVIIDRVGFTGFTLEAINMPAAYYVSISGCRFLNIADIAAAGGQATNSAIAIKVTSNVLEIHKCRFSNNDRNIVIDYSHQVEISDCSFEGSGTHTRAGYTPDYFIDIGSISSRAFNFFNNYTEDERTATNKSVMRLNNAYAPRITGNFWEGSFGGITKTHNFIETTNCFNTTVSGNTFSETFNYFITTLDTNVISAWHNVFFDGGTQLTSNAQIAPYLTTNLVELTGDFLGVNVGIGTNLPRRLFDVAGNIGLNASAYLNWGAVDGTLGYGFRDNAGTMEVKNSAGAWAAIGGGGSGTVTHTAGALTLDLPVFGNGASDLKVGTKTGTGNELTTSQSPTIVTPVIGQISSSVRVTGSITNDALTASRLVATDANKALVSTISSANAASSVTDETGSGLMVFGTGPTLTDAIAASSFQLPNGAAPTTDAFGEIAGDNNAWAAGRGTVQLFDGTANAYVVAALASDVPSNGQVPTWNTGGTVTWETGSGGAQTNQSISALIDAYSDNTLYFNDFFQRWNIAFTNTAIGLQLFEVPGSGEGTLLLLETQQDPSVVNALWVRRDGTNMFLISSNNIVVGASLQFLDGAHTASSLAVYDAATNLISGAQSGSGTTYLAQGSPTITTPTIASFVNSTHTHQAASGGGQLVFTNATFSNLDLLNVAVNDVLAYHGAGVWTNKVAGGLPAISTQGGILMSDGANPYYELPNVGETYFERFTSGITVPGGEFASFGTVTRGSGDATHNGVIVGTSTGADQVVACSQTAFTFGGGAFVCEMMINVSAVSDGTDTFTIRAGYGDSVTTEFTDGVFFRYTDSVNSGNWQGVCRAAGVESVVNGGVAFAAGWKRLRFTVNAAGTSASFSVDGVSLGAAVTTNIPLTTQVCGRTIMMDRTAGTTSRTISIDYFAESVKWSSAK